MLVSACVQHAHEQQSLMAVSAKIQRLHYKHSLTAVLYFSKRGRLHRTARLFEFSCSPLPAARLCVCMTLCVFALLFLTA